MAAPVGFGNTGGALVTPNSTTSITIDTPQWNNLVPAFFLEYEFEKIASNKANLPLNTIYIPSVGWTLTPFQVQPFNKYETDNANATVFTPSNSNITLATGSSPTTGIFEVNNQKANTDLPGVTLGPNQQQSGDPFLEKMVDSTGSDTWDISLASDASAFPPPDLANDIVPCDRIAVTNFNHDPRFGVHFRFKILGTATQNPQRIFKLYFTGLPTYLQTDSAPGCGQYSLILQGDGTAELWEVLTPTSSSPFWQRRQVFRWSYPGASVNGSHDLWIASDCNIDQFGNFVGTNINFQFGAANAPFSQGPQNASQNVTPSIHSVYQIKQQAPVQPALAPIRVDIRRDQKARFQLSTSTYSQQGTLYLNRFTIPFVPYGTNPLSIEYYGAIPAGCSVTIQLQDAQGVVQTPFSSGSDIYGGFQTFTLIQGSGNPPSTTYDVILTFNANTDASLTPIINRIRLVRPNELINNVGGSTGFPFPTTFADPVKVEKISWSGASTDISQESYGFKVADLASQLKSTLGTRARMPGQFSITVTNPQSSGANSFTSIIGNFTVLSSPFQRIGGKRRNGLQGTPQLFPSPNWGRYEMACVGPWYRLYDQLSPQTINFAVNANTLANGPGPWKVTDIIRYLLLTCAGFPLTMVDIPDLSIQYFGDAQNPLYLEVKSQIGPLCVQLARDYLGGWLFFDSNATNGGGPTDTYGCWRLILPPQSKYTDPETNLPSFNNLCTFWTGAMPYNTVQPSIFALGLSPASFPQVNNTIVGAGQKMVNTWMKRMTLQTLIVPPEFNMLTVTGVGIGTSLMAAGDGTNQTTMTQTLVNPISAFFAPTQAVTPDPSNPDYLGYIKEAYYSDPGLNSPDLVNFTARRIFDIAGHAQIWATFEAPLVFVTDATDTKQIRPRPLRYGDPVLVMDQVTNTIGQFFVHSVNGEYEFATGGNSNQMVVYEIFAMSFDASQVPWSGDVTN